MKQLKTNVNFKNKGKNCYKKYFYYRPCVLLKLMLSTFRVNIFGTNIFIRSILRLEQGRR